MTEQAITGADVTDSYDDYDGGYGAEDATNAPDVDGVAGACPPLILRFRIYPEADFNAIFGDPPENVVT